MQRDDQRVRLHRVGPYSFDIEVFAYVPARDWNEFLQVQEQLLFGVTESGAVGRLPSRAALPWPCPRKRRLRPAGSNQEDDEGPPLRDAAR